MAQGANSVAGLALLQFIGNRRLDDLVPEGAEIATVEIESDGHTGGYNVTAAVYLGEISDSVEWRIIKARSEDGFNTSEHVHVDDESRGA